ncbi:cyclic nucleotide-binding protein [Solidesulfovibrio fructosivorans JJ]]|uniref:Cyclic nucleotide-binding protein n=1 Tax=Solidesulfovibrio fructosivorans JJ] TaxID=596151 RepID=E1JUK2_SOLFR|nr:HDIG domain-containing metalloprotein [Solidesulfovibrio fructosivorans]EFL52132.1 cyclic nucleotide-binding protein [Solidesulfovibrio fructosivorans JJ]]
MSEIANKVKRKLKSHPGAQAVCCAVTANGLPGFVFFLAIVFALSFLARLGLDNSVKIFTAGEIASQDVAADQNLQIEDVEATSRKREQVAQSQPPVFDVSPLPYEALAKSVDDILASVRNAGGEDLDKLRWQIAENLNTEIGGEIIEVWRQDGFKNLIDQDVLPWLKQNYEQGVVASTALFAPYKNGILIRDLPSMMETLRMDTREIKDIKQVKDDMEHMLKVSMNKPFRVRKAVYTLVNPFIAPNMTFNQDTTQVRRREISQAVEPLYYIIKKGEVIVRQGERVGPIQQLKLQALYSHRKGSYNMLRALGIFGMCLMFLAVLYASLERTGVKRIRNTDWIFLGVILLIFGLLAKMGDVVTLPGGGGLPEGTRALYFAFSLPMAGAAGILALFFSKRLCIFVSLILAFLASNMVFGGVGIFCYYFVGSMIYIYLMKRSETRAQVLKATLPLFAALCVMWVSINLMDLSTPAVTGTGFAFVALSAFLSLLAVVGIAPIMELLFSYTSRFRLMELLNLEQPLLQELMVKAPGTYHHSLIVSNMVEAGARNIGANPLLAKVAALYHDIGKLKSPHYFIENISCKENRHNKLAPSMSALILIAHVKKGVELAREHRLGQQITDLIGQHHGTTLIAYFHHKAKEMAEAKGEEPVREEDYRYPGPKPQSKEAGLILLADAIEASSRTLVDPTPSRIKGHIQNIVRKIYTEGELDDSQLTLKDLTLLTDTFHRILTGIFHQRIEYPSAKTTEVKNGKTREEPVCAVDPKNAAEHAA